MKRYLNVNGEWITEKVNHNIKPGDIFAASWGYDQTNVDFYQVIKTTAASVTVKAIESKKIYSSDMVGTAQPLKDKFINDETIRRALYQFGTDAPYIKIASYEYARLVDPNIKMRFSEYA